MTDLRLKCPFTMLVASPSKSGKSTYVAKLLRKSNILFDKPSEQFYYFYNVWSPTFDGLTDSLPNIKFIKGICDMQWLEENCSQSKDVTIVVDDQALNITKEVAEVFAVGSHQYGVNFILMAQNLYTKGKYFRDASINTTYILCGKNPRDQLSIRTLAQQMYPTHSKDLIEAYRRATRKPYGYLLIDCTQTTPDTMRLRSNILMENEPMSTYLRI